MGGKETEERLGRTKDVDLSIEIEASPEAVWRAISEGEELARWFPPEAEVVPGVGGTVTIAWGPGVAGTGLIDIWEENRRLRYVESPTGEADPGPPDAETGAAENGAAEPGAETAPEAPVVAVDFTIEGRAGRTALRLVNSGFSADDDWADYFETVQSGWRYFLFNLKHYLERHDGTPRRMVWDRRTISLGKPEAWERLFAEGGLVTVAGPGQKGELWSGHAVAVEMAAPPIHLACRCEELNDALLFVELEPGGDTYSLGVWLSLYGVDEADAEALDRSLKACLERLVP